MGRKIPIPSNVVGDFNVNPVLVCEQAFDYLKMIWKKPIIHLAKLNPLLPDENPVLRHMCEKRRQANTLYRMIDYSSRASGDIPHIINNTIGMHRCYLFISDSLYSMEDLVSILDGRLLQHLSNFVISLSKCVGA